MSTWRQTLGPVLLLVVGASCREEPPDPTPPDEPPPLTTDQVDQICAAFAQCSPLGSDNLGECALAAMSRPAAGLRYTEELAACLGEAGTDCAEVERCVPVATEDPCEGLGQETLCRGDRVVACFGGAVEYISDCEAWGLTCVELDEGATCQGDGRSCLSGDERCEGDEAVLCVGFREVRFDCSQLIEDRTCSDEEDRVRCVAPEAVCDPYDSPDRCEGDAIAFCSASGEAALIDCAAAGFTTCREESGRAICGDGE